MWNAIKAIKLWQVGVLVVVLVGAAAGVYFGFNMTRSSDGAGLTKDQQAVPAQVGNLVNQVSVSGALTYPNTEALTFESAGTVSKVLVTEGQKVKAGQSLAQLDNASVASLQKAVAQAQVNLETAQAELDAAKAPYTATDIAQAEANVAAKKLAVQSAQKALDAAKTPYSAADIAQAEANVSAKKLAVQTAQKALDAAKAPYSAADIAQAEANVSAKKLALQTAQQNLDNLLKPTDQALAQARSAVSNAQLAVQKAKQELDALKATSATEDVDKARSTLDTAKVNLKNSQADQAASVSDWDTKVATAQDAYDTAATNYKNVFSKYLGINLTDAQAAQSPDALLTSLRIDLATLYDRQSVPLAIGPGGQVSIPPDDPSTAWNETVVFAWTYLRPGTVFGTCESFTLPANSVCVRSEIDAVWTPAQTTANTLATTRVQADKAVAAAQKAVEQAQDALASAQKALDLLVAGADPVVAHQASVKAKEDQLAVAQASLKTAQDNLDKLLKPDSLNVDSLRQQVALAKTQLADTEQRLADVKAGADSLNLESLAKQLDLTKTQLADTEQCLADVKAGADPLNVDSLAKQLDLTKTQLADTEQRLADVKAGADPANVALKEANLSSAKLALKTAQDRLAKASLPATFDGVVSLVSVVNGQAVNANTSVLTLADTSVVEVSGNVDEIDILYVKAGATATVTLDALKGQTLQGTVSSISSAATTSSSVVRYPVRIRVTVPSGVELRAGLTATASVVLRQENNVLLIPSLAVRGSYTEPYVLLADSGKTKQQAVTLGNSDDYWVVVTQGLKEGDQVVMDVSTTTAQSNINAAMRQFQLGAGAVPGGGVFTGGGMQMPQGSGSTGSGQQRPQTQTGR